MKKYLAVVILALSCGLFALPIAENYTIVVPDNANKIEGRAANQFAAYIGKATGLAKTSLTSMLERMEKKGLIVKRPSEEDKRSTIVALSEGTESYREVIEKVSLKIGEEYYRGIKPKEAERFEATLKKILDNLK